jgi:hypothetical protein
MPNTINKPVADLHIKQSIHDLNNIFTSTLNSIELLENLSQKNKLATKLTLSIKNNSMRAIDIIQDLAGGSSKTTNIISLKQLAKDIEYTIKPTLNKGIKIKFRFGINLNNVVGNYSDLYRVFLNIITNSIEALKGNGIITFSVKNNRKKDKVIISVKDNGIGISKNRIKRIFEMGNTSKSKNTNSGLGLSIVKEIIENLNGTIEVLSKLKVGTEFLITLPAKNKGKIVDTKNGKAFSILLADDDKTILELFSELLVSYNFKVTTAEDGKDALSKYKLGQFDLIIIDKIMPNLNGIEFIKKIRNINKTIPIILTTGSHDALETDGKDLSINSVVKKPWAFNDMLDVIRNLLV